MLMPVYAKNMVLALRAECFQHFFVTRKHTAVRTSPGPGTETNLGAQLKGAVASTGSTETKNDSDKLLIKVYLENSY